MNTSDKVHFREVGGRLLFEIDGVVYFDDDVEHITQAFYRLMQMDDRSGRAFIARACDLAARRCGIPFRDMGLADAIAVLSDAWSDHDLVLGDGVPNDAESLSLGGFNLRAETLWSPAIADAHDHLMVGSLDPLPHAWLVDRAHGRRPHAPEYEEEYFEGAVERVGYGSYAEQGGWRMEKSRRQVRQVRASMAFAGVDSAPGTRCLDVGCGYGYFRAAAGEVGWHHDGLEVSHFAAEIGHEMFGFQTFVGEMGDLLSSRPELYDVIVMWDFIEHVRDPDEVVRLARALLAPGGFVFVRTPSLMAVEREVFGSDYHSLKLEHLHVFSPESLARTLGRAGVEPVVLTTESHLLQGFLGSRVRELAVTNRGSDIFCGGRVP